MSVGRSNAKKTPSKSAIAAAAGLIVIPRSAINEQTQQPPMCVDSLRMSASALPTSRSRVDGSPRHGSNEAASSSSWCVRPVHLSHADALLSDSMPPVPDICGGTLQDGVASSPFHVPMLSRPMSPVDAVDDEEVMRNSSLSIERLLSVYFPATIGAHRMLAVDDLGSPSARSSLDAASNRSMTAASAPVVIIADSSQTKRRQRTGVSRSSSAMSSSSSASNASCDSHNALLSASYQTDLTRLQLERLRLEEDHLLELKRQAELERIRGPQPKWYEIRTSGFHGEARRNNDLIRNRGSWQAMLDYRIDLERASYEFKNAASFLTQQQRR